MNTISQARIDAWQAGHLDFVPGEPTAPALPSGVHGFEGWTGQQHVIFVPDNLAEEAAHPLLVFLHGATSDPEQALSMIARAAEARGIIVLATKSAGPSWDILEEGYGPDIVTLETALKLVGDRMRIDPDRLAIGGFSDGASYALSVGLCNGAIFRNIIAMSPGFAAPGIWRGRPDIFLSHGARDSVLSVDLCSRFLSAMLTQSGYHVDYREFDGGHTAPPDIVTAAMDVAETGRLAKAG